MRISVVLTNDQVNNVISELNAIGVNEEVMIKDY